jgi:hypothetical protein
VGRALGVLGGLGMTAIGDMVSEEVRDRLDHLPHAVLRLAARRLDPGQRAIVYDDEWLPELTYILKGDEARPITRLYHGGRFTLGILVTARRISDRLEHAVPTARDDSLAFDRIVSKAALSGSVQYARLSGIIHGAVEADPKAQALAVLEREIVRMHIYVDALSEAIGKAGATRGQRRQIRRQRKAVGYVIKRLSGIRDETAGQSEARSGHDD